MIASVNHAKDLLRRVLFSVFDKTFLFPALEKASRRGGLLFAGGVLLGTTVARADMISLGSDNPEVVWKTKAVAEVPQDGAALSRSGIGTAHWLRASIPGTAFGAAVAAGIEKNPDFGDNVERVDHAKYNRDFWYRAEFAVPASFQGRAIWLNFAGINKSGDIYLNGTKLGSLYGFMQRGRYDVTKLVHSGPGNVLAVSAGPPQE
ncbi:MAG TPA: sugar-binding domain-containing protein, partial [Candidatus Methylacidiphilales bacterium]